MKKIVKRVSNIVNKMEPTQIMVIGFAIVILIGAILLSMPISTQNGESIGFLDALFTSTSAVCVTGLIAVDTSTYWSFFGQLIIITLIQIGGLGFMTVTTLFSLIIKKRINLKERLLIQESLNQIDLSGLVKLTRYILLTTFFIEGTGALLLSTVFIPQFGILNGIWYSIFHAISAFCNAGFDLMGVVSGPFSSLTYYVNNFTITITISLLIILGGIGFPVILDVIRNKKLSKLTIHSKVVLFSTIVLIAFGMLFILLLEYNNPNTLGKLGFGGKILASLFQSITIRTAGFNTIDLAAMRESS
ncbi:MAG TPA: Trk family potassium uptake protein, partial [Romboutsia timonensis]|nr:Trk family potassium uptake protein [Romboutsia timonensis]